MVAWAFTFICCKHTIVFHAPDHKRMYGSHIGVDNIPMLIRSRLVYWKPTAKCSLVQLVFKILFLMIRSQKHYLQPIWLVRARTRANLWKVFPKNIRMNHYRDSLAWVSKKIVFFSKKEKWDGFKNRNLDHPIIKYQEWFFCFRTRCQIWCTIEFHRDPISKVLSEW